MQQARDDLFFVDEQSSRDCAKLIRKLRWIGMEEEARRLELSLNTLPPEKRGLSNEPLGTD